MLAKHMNTVRQRWRTNLFPFSITLHDLVYPYTKSGAALAQQVTPVVKKFTKGLDILSNWDYIYTWAI